MSLNKGDLLYIPCEVKPGPFSHERMVLVREEVGAREEWFGFVETMFLERKVLRGKDVVVGWVTSVREDGSYVARMPGQDNDNFIGDPCKGDGVRRALINGAVKD